MISSTFVDCSDRQVSRLFAFENPPRVDAGQTICIRYTASVAHQTASRSKLPILIDRGHSVAERQRGELFPSVL